MTAQLVTLGALLCAGSGLFSVLPGRKWSGVGAGTVILGALIGCCGCLLGLSGPVSTIVAPWHVPGGSLQLTVDALSAFFALPVFVLGAAGALYAERYWPVTRARGGSVRLFFGLAVGALVIVMIADHSILFLAAWELVTVAAFFLVGTEHEKDEVRRASWIFLAASHVAVLALFGVFTLMHAETGTWAIEPLPTGAASLPAGRAILWLATFGFGIKAGLMPLHVWLPGAHAAAPSHVSALMSGVMIKMGIYGFLRILSLFDSTPMWFGATVLVLGIVSSVLGVAFALVQHDLKRLLAYHSIENIGIIVTGLGVGLLATSHGAHGIAFLGYAGALLHVWNHSLFKGLLFLSAGSVIHATGTRQIDRLGGLAGRMPWTAGAFVLGAVAICGLPPLNGFVSEWILYVAGFEGMLSPGAGWTWLLVVAVGPALALTGALALACFVKAFAAVFLGTPREPGRVAEEAPMSMRWAMSPLAAGCVAIGLLPALFLPVLSRVVGAASGLTSPDRFADSLWRLQSVGIAVAIVVAAAVLLLLRVVRQRRVAGPTWDCGYAGSAPRAQYTASSLASTIAGYFAWAMPADVHAPGKLGLFPSRATFESHVPDTVLDRVLLPAIRYVERLVGLARYVRSARVQMYLLSLVATLVVLLIWSAS